MKRSGRILMGIACAALWCALARAENGPGLPAPVSKATSARLDAIRQKMIRENKAFLQKRHLTAPPMAMPAIPGAETPPANTPPASTLPATRVSPTPNTDTPYGSIVTRNVFGLMPIPVQDPNQQFNSGPPPPKITVTGITTIFGPPEALFKVAGIIVDNKPQDKSYILQEGQSEDEMEVTSIDTKKDIVTFNNHGQTQTIPLANGVAVGGSSGSGGSPPPNNPFMRRLGGFPRPAFGGGNRGNENVPQRMGNSYNPAGNNGNNYTPNGQSYNYNGGNNNNPNNGGSQLSADDIAALVAAQHAAAANDPKSPVPPFLFPPTKYDPDAGVPGAADPSAITPK